MSDNEPELLTLNASEIDGGGEDGGDSVASANSGGTTSASEATATQVPGSTPAADGTTAAGDQTDAATRGEPGQGGDQPASESGTRRTATAGARPGTVTQPNTGVHKPTLEQRHAEQGRRLAEANKEREELRAWRAGQEQEIQRRQQAADQANLRRWDPKHPEHSRFQSLLDRRAKWGAQRQAIEASMPAGPERDKVLTDLAGATFTPQEQGELQEHQEMTRQFLSNPHAAAEQVAERTASRLIQQAFQQQNQHFQAVSQVQEDFKNLSAEMRPILKRELETGTPYEAAVRIAKLEADNLRLQGQVGPAQAQARAAGEQTRLARSAATITRDPRVAGGIAPYDAAKAECKKRGISLGKAGEVNTDTNDFRRILREMEARQKT